MLSHSVPVSHRIWLLTSAAARQGRRQNSVGDATLTPAAPSLADSDDDDMVMINVNVADENQDLDEDEDATEQKGKDNA